MENSSQKLCRKSQSQIWRKCNGRGSGFSIPFIAFEWRAHLWTTRGRPYKFATSGNRSALTLAGLVPSAGLSARPAHAAGETLAQRAFRQLHSCQTRRRWCRKSMPDTAERGNRIMAIFHFTVKIVGRSKGKSVISASAYLNGDVMKNEETGRISYYTSKK